MRDGLWLRALVLCDDVRFELGGTVSLMGVYGETIVVPSADTELALPKLVIYCAVGGLREADEIGWRQLLRIEGGEAAPLAGRKEPHDPRYDEHRLVNVLAPVIVPRPGRCRLTLELETTRERRAFDHEFTIERA